MRLQIKELTGPDQIKLNSNTTTTYATALAANNTEDRFTCHFNRNIEDEDQFPLNVTIRIYNNLGTLQNTFTLAVNRDNINDDNNFCFTVTLNSPQTLSGSYFYVHALLLNTDANAHNVSYEVSSYHLTIKKTHIYSDKQFTQVYWSTNEQITDLTTQEGLRTGRVGQNEDIFLHIKAKGMYSDTIGLVLHTGNNTILMERRVSLNQNKLVVAFNVSQVIQQYMQQTRQTGENISFTLKATVAVAVPQTEEDTNNTQQTATTTENASLERSIGHTILTTLTRIVLSPLLLFSGCTSSGPRTENEENEPPIITGSTDTLNIVCTDVNSPTKKTSTGTVYVNVQTAEIEAVVPTKFRDFKIGCVVHLEGIGRTVARNNNSQAGTFYTVYPIRVYEVRLSDLVASGLVTINEAAYLTTIGNNGTTLRQEADLLNTFNKSTARLSATKTLISIFQDTANSDAALRNRINTSNVRKILAQVNHKTSLWTEADGQEMCRDGWQLISGRARSNGLKEVFNRNQNGRYNTNKECPPGEYFLNWIVGGTYRIFVAQEPTGSSIYTYPGRQAGDRDRGAIALHRGGAKAAIGCITFNVTYGANGNYANFNNIVYEPKNGQQSNNHWINLLCIDERNAIQSQNDTHTVQRKADKTLPVTANFWRWYDLTTPR